MLEAIVLSMFDITLCWMGD